MYVFDFIQDAPEQIFEALMILVGSIAATGLLAALMVRIVFWFFRCQGLCRLAYRRGIRNAWLAWLPIGHSWLLGCVSDQYRYLVKGQDCSKRKLLLGLCVFNGILTAASLAISGSLGYHVLDLMLSGGSPEQLALEPLVMALGAVVLCAVTVVRIALWVTRYVALYDLYASCVPKWRVLYEILSLLLPITVPFLLYGCRELDGGMPPRRAYTEAETQTAQ